MLLLLYSQVYCGLMLFNVIHIWEGEFRNLDCSVSLSRRGKSRTSTGSCTKSPPLPGVPPPQGMADDRSINSFCGFAKKSKAPRRVWTEVDVRIQTMKNLLPCCAQALSDLEQNSSPRCGREQSNVKFSSRAGEEEHWYYVGITLCSSFQRWR